MQLGICFLAHQSNYSHALKGSDEPYDDLFFTWGATPLTTRLYSSDQISVIEDGCGFDRSQKVECRAKKTNSSSHIYVCSAGSQMDRNRSKCEECTRTILNYCANNRPIPSSFPAALSREIVQAVVIQNEGQTANLRSIQCLASKNMLSGTPVGCAIDHALFSYKYRVVTDVPRSISAWLKRQIKRLVKPMIGRP